MIAYLKGIILEKGLTYIILSAGGGSQPKADQPLAGPTSSGRENFAIGYKIFVTPETLEMKAGDSVSLYTYLKVSDDGQSLYGLPDFNTLQFFEMLITVSGVGPKVALAILSAARVDAVRQAISNQDAAVFTRISGIGLKTAEKIIVELKNKVASDKSQVTGSDAFEALIALGYNSREVREALKKIDVNLSSSAQLKEALKLLGRD
jgi:holliday junction DNA helicase RuvA